MRFFLWAEEQRLPAFFPPSLSHFCLLVCSAGTMFSICAKTLLWRQAVAALWSAANAQLLACVHELNKSDWGKLQCQNAKMKCSRAAWGAWELSIIHYPLSAQWGIRLEMKVCHICWTKFEATPSHCCTAADPAAQTRVIEVLHLLLHVFKEHLICFECTRRQNVSLCCAGAWLYYHHVSVSGSAPDIDLW